MDITAYTNAMSLQNVNMQVSASVLKMSMDTVEEASECMIKMMEQSVNPNVGSNIDISI
ncbi:MAG TPA: YjfB family protein [Lachnospiraceae bacterium]|nr:YjfB family protein [Lachnospiraceae bacterium]